jgi:NitT/TauT family transport system substrate-binding protein
VASQPPSGGAGVTQVTYLTGGTPRGYDCPAFLALEKGFFAENGLAVQVSRGYGSADTAVRVSQGQADFGTAGMAATVDVITQGSPLRIVGTYAHTHMQAIYALPEASVNSAADLAGKRVVDEVAAESHALIRAYLKKEGVDYDAVDWLFVDNAGLAQIQAGQAEVALDWISNLGEWWLLDPPIEPTTLWIGEALGISGYGVIAHPDTVRDRPEVARDFLDGLYRGWLYLIDNAAHDECVDALFKYHPELEAQDNARDFQLSNIKLFETLNLTEATREHGIGYSHPDRAQATLDFMNEYLLEEPVELEDVFAIDDALISDGQFKVTDFDAAVESVRDVLGRPNPLIQVP